MSKSRYSKLYTLVIPFEDETHSVLNGRIFRIKASADGHLHFIDPIYDEELLESTSVSNREDYNNGTIIVNTNSGTSYYLARLSSLLPTKLSDPVPAKKDTSNISPTGVDKAATEAFQKRIQDALKATEEAKEVKTEVRREDKVSDVISHFDWSSLKVINELSDVKPINYGDGYTSKMYTFNKALTMDEFLAWCVLNNLPINEKGAWYEDYTEVIGSANMWTWKRINRYTD